MRRKRADHLEVGDEYRYWSTSRKDRDSVLSSRIVMKVMSPTSEGRVRLAVGLPSPRGPIYWGVHTYAPDDEIILA